MKRLALSALPLACVLFLGCKDSKPAAGGTSQKPDSAVIEQQMIIIAATTCHSSRESWGPTT